MDAQKTRMSENEFAAFLRLLNEEEGRTLSHLSDRFKRLVIEDPQWKQWLLVRRQEIAPTHRAFLLLEELRWELIGRSFERLVRNDGEHFDLEEGLTLLAQFSSPDVLRGDIAGPLDRMAEELSHLLTSADDEEGAIKIFKHYLFKTQGFYGNVSNYYDPDNSYLHKVLDRKVGIPISLASVCLLLAQRLVWKGEPFPVYGVGLPTHFIAQFRFPGHSVYFDPFNRGKALSRRDCIELLRTQDIAFQESYLSPVSAHAVLSRSITNLTHVYSALGEERKKDQLVNYLQILNGEAE